MAVIHFKDAMSEIFHVIDLGDDKHGEAQWLYSDKPWTGHAKAAVRHLVCWLLGRRDESGKSHLAHAIVRLMILLQLEISGHGKDDRDPIAARILVMTEAGNVEMTP